MSSALTDNELRSKLEEMGENVGPITKTTRQLWEKKLEKVMQGQAKFPSCTVTLSNMSNLSHISSDENKDALCTPKTLLNRVRRRRTIGPNPLSNNTANEIDVISEESLTFKISNSSIKNTSNSSTNTSNTNTLHYTSDLTRPSVRASKRSNYSDLGALNKDNHDQTRRSARKVALRVDENINSTLKADWNNSNRTEMNASTGNEQNKSSHVTNSELPYHPSFGTASEQRVQPSDIESGSINDVVTATSRATINEEQVSNSKNRTSSWRPLKRKRNTVSPVIAEASSDIATYVTTKEQYYEEKLKMEKEYHELRMQFQREEQQRREEEHNWKLQEHKIKMKLKENFIFN